MIVHDGMEHQPQSPSVDAFALRRQCLRRLRLDEQCAVQPGFINTRSKKACSVANETKQRRDCGEEEGQFACQDGGAFDRQGNRV